MHHEAKFMTPKKIPNTLPRNRIAKAIDDAFPSRAICIVAPYGFGKTVAVASWLHEYNRQAAWINLDEHDNSESALLGKLTAAVLTLVHKQESICDFREEPKYVLDSHKYLYAISSLPPADGKEKILVLDNFIHIRDNKLLHYLSEFIVAHLGDWRFILISRKELPPTFNDMILKGRIRLITIRDLIFDSKEVSEYLNINGHILSQQETLSIREATEGWPAALNAVLAVSGDAPPAYDETARNYIRGYFETEIWVDLDENIREFLMKTSILEKLTPSSCHAVTDIGATNLVIGWLLQNGLFILKVGEMETYRYHRVFRDFIQYKLETSGIEENQLMKKYAWWLYERNEFEQAFSYFFKSGDLNGVRLVLKKMNLENIGIDCFLASVGCITTLCAEELKPFPEIVAIMSLVHYLRNEIPEMQSLVHTLEDWLEPGHLSISAEEYAEFRWEVGWLYYLDPAKNANDSTHLEHSNYRYYVPHLKALHISRFAVLSLPSCFRGIRDYGNDYIVGFDEFLERVEDGEKHLIDEEEVLWTTYLISAEFEYECENFDKAEKIIRRIMPLVEERHYTYLYFICTAVLVKITRARNRGEIDSLTSRLEVIIQKNGHQYLLPNFHAFEMRNKIACGQVGFSDSFLNENMAITDTPYLHLLYRHITYVRGLLSSGGYSEALIILGNLEITCKKYSRPTDLLEISVLMSIAYFKLGQHNIACDIMLSTLESAKRYGYIRIFADDATEVVPILLLMQKQIEDKYTRKVINSCKKSFARSKNKIIDYEQPYTELTKTEHKILKYLQTGMSYAEIALENSINISTVKSHAHSIYSKLAVSNRTSAVLLAQKMGILN